MLTGAKRRTCYTVTPTVFPSFIPSYLLPSAQDNFESKRCVRIELSITCTCPLDGWYQPVIFHSSLFCNKNRPDSFAHSAKKPFHTCDVGWGGGNLCWRKAFPSALLCLSFSSWETPRLQAESEPTVWNLYVTGNFGFEGDLKPWAWWNRHPRRGAFLHITCVTPVTNEHKFQQSQWEEYTYKMKIQATNSKTNAVLLVFK